MEVDNGSLVDQSVDMGDLTESADSPLALEAVSTATAATFLEGCGSSLLSSSYASSPAMMAESEPATRPSITTTASSALQPTAGRSIDSINVETSQDTVPAGCTNIDESDERDPQWVTHYVNAIFENLRENEVRPLILGLLTLPRPLPLPLPLPLARSCRS